MPLEDVVSPVIAAFLAGRKAKEDREKSVRDKQAAEDESKIRQQQAQKLAKEVAHFDKNAELEDQQKQIALTIAKNNMKHEFLTGVAEGRYKIPQVVTEAAREAAMKGDWNDELVTPGMQGMLNRTPTMGIPDKFDIGGGVEINRGEIMTPEEMNANKVANALAMIKPKVEEHRQTRAIDEASQGRILDKQFGQQNLAREDTQAFTAGENVLNRASQEKRDANRTAAQEALAKLQRNTQLNIAAMHEAGANKRNKATIDAKAAVNDTDVDDFIKTNLVTPLMTRQGVTRLGKAAEQKITQKAALQGVKIITDADQKTLSELAQFNVITDTMTKLSKEIGNGATFTNYTGDWTSLGKSMKQLETFKPYLAKMTSVKGTQSDQDTKIAGGNLLELKGEGVAKTNQERIKALKRVQAGIFLSFFPKGTNPEQIINAADTFGIDQEGLKLLDEEIKSRKPGK
jgi:hypothetical protein